MSAADVRSRLSERKSPRLERLRDVLTGWRTPGASLRELVSARRARRDPLRALAIDEEIENHILERTEKLIEQGMSAPAARREAERRFGSVRRVRRALEGIGESSGPGPGGELFGSIVRDLGLGLRAVRHAPGFAFAVILTIGLGVGANAAVFSVTDAVLLRPLPYEDPDELVAIESRYPDSDRVIDRFPVEQALVWRVAEPELDGLVVFARHGFVRTDTEDPEDVVGFAVSVDWLDTLGARPALGRTFAPDEAIPGAPGTIILGHELWRTRFGAADDVIGDTIELDGREYTVIGVMPAWFKFPVVGRANAWVPLQSDGTIDGARSSVYASLLARLQEGMSIAALQERLDTLSAGLAEADPRPEGWGVRVRTFDNFRANRDVTRALWVLTGAVAVMLLIAAANAANLLLVRATARRGDNGVRIALGASRWRLVRQQLIENLVLVGAGGLLALVMARAVLGSLVSLLPDEVTLTIAGEIAVNGRVLLYALGATVLTGLLLGMVPLLQGGAPALAGESRGASASRSAKWLRAGLVVGEVAMTVTLLVGAGLLINSFLRLTTVDPGYETANIFQLSLALPGDEYPDTASQRAFFDRVAEGIAALPGVTSVSLADGVPPSAGFSFGITPQAEGREPEELPALLLPNASVDAAFFRTLGAPIVAGRGFGAEDTRESGHVIVDREMARFLWGSESPIGRRFRVDADDSSPWLTVIGMVDDIKLMGQDDRQGAMDLFYPLPPDAGRPFLSVVARTATDPAALFPAVRAVVRELDNDLPIYRLRTGEQALAEVNEKPRFFLLMMSAFAAIALGLAGIGTYGVLAFNVRQRQRELGVRIALGADGAALRGMVLRQGVGLALAGVIIGLAGATALGGVARSLLFEVEPTDPATLAAVAAVMLGCAALACWIPARRATRVDPVEVLRAQ